MDDDKAAVFNCFNFLQLLSKTSQLFSPMDFGRKFVLKIKRHLLNNENTANIKLLLFKILQLICFKLKLNNFHPIFQQIYWLRQELSEITQRKCRSAPMSLGRAKFLNTISMNEMKTNSSSGGEQIQYLYRALLQKPK